MSKSCYSFYLSDISEKLGVKQGEVLATPPNLFLSTKGTK
jgi:hypothetical protein